MQSALLVVTIIEVTPSKLRAWPTSQCSQSEHNHPEALEVPLSHVTKVLTMCSVRVRVGTTFIMGTLHGVIIYKSIFSEVLNNKMSERSVVGWCMVGKALVRVA